MKPIHYISIGATVFISLILFVGVYAPWMAKMKAKKATAATSPAK
jgi:hypothetical protein